MSKRRKRKLTKTEKIENALKKNGELTMQQLDRVLKTVSAYWGMEDEISVNPYVDEEW